MKRLTSWLQGGREKRAKVASRIVDPLSTEFIADPAPLYGRLRGQKDLAEVAGGGYLLVRQADVEAAFTNRSLGNAPSRFSVLSARNKDKYLAAEIAANIPPFLDRPDHVESRKALSHCFFRTLETANFWVGPLAESTVRQQPRDTDIDAVSAIATPFVVSAMARFVGLPEDKETLLASSDALFRLFAPISDRETFDETNEKLRVARLFILNSINVSSGPNRDTLISQLKAWQSSKGTLEDEQIADNALLVLANGIENIRAGIAQTLLELSVRPEIATAAKEGIADLESIVREALRLSSPGQIIPRVALEETEICGHLLKEGTPVYLALGSANLDPIAYPQPDAFVHDRENRSRFTFGQGRHRCIGEPLALLLVSSLLKPLLAANVQLMIEPRDVEYHARFGHRWPVNLPVMLCSLAKHK